MSERNHFPKSVPEDEDLCADPTTRGLVGDIDHFAVHDGPGIRTAVYLKGCPLHCIWCHSPETQSFSPELLYLPQKCSACGLCLSACAQDALSPVEVRSTNAEEAHDLPRGGRLGKLHALRSLHSGLLHGRVKNGRNMDVRSGTRCTG